MFPRHPASDSLKRRQFVPLMSGLCSFKGLKLYLLNFTSGMRKLKLLCLSKYVIIVLHKNTRKLINHLKQAQKSVSN